MRLAHISDLHLLSPEYEPEHETAGNGFGSTEMAMAIADDLIAISDGLDLVIVSGDLTDRADAASFATIERILGQIDLPVLVVPGNHDGPSGMIDYLRHATTLADWDLSNRAVRIGAFKFIGLNTSVDGLTEGALDDAALAFVERHVAQDRDRQLAIVMHHPPLLLGLDQFDGFCQIENGADFLRILAGAGRETLVFSGHVHRPYTARNGNVACYVAGSMIAPYDSAHPFGADPIRPAALQDFYFIHDIDPGGRHVVTPQRVRGLADRLRHPQ